MKVVGYIPKSKKSPPVFPCPHCDKEYASEAALNKHIKEKHSAPANPPANSPDPDNGGGDD